MPRNQIDPCMFCGEVPCSCPEAQKPKAKPRKKSTVSSNSSIPSDSGLSSSVSPTPNVTPAVDLKAAMRVQYEQDATIATPLDTSRYQRNNHKVRPKQPEGLNLTYDAPKLQVPSISRTEDPEFVYALAVLEPILAKAERELWARTLDEHYTPAQRWRIRNAHS